MGEVYRADDLKLSQPVALKFLPESAQHDPEWLARFYNEARMARQVTHPAVCRVHDVGDVEGQIFLSIEYVDGEDLATLLKRIGRLPPAKAAEIARQVSAGLVHRSRQGGSASRPQAGEHHAGRRGARASDGLRPRRSGGILAGRGGAVGNAAYMSPEQLAGREVTARSDVYSLGLVIYELVTGRRAFEGTTLAELMRQRENPPPRPSELVPEVDPRLEKMILQCLEKDPPRRPSSALSVAAGLPGGDPLAALLASGETPSPEMVAAAGEVEERISPRLAWASVGALAAVLVLAPILSGPAQPLGVLPEMKPPKALEDRAREIIDQLGYPKTAVDQAVGYAVDSEYFSYVSRQRPIPPPLGRLESGRPAGASLPLSDALATARVGQPVGPGLLEQPAASGFRHDLDAARRARSAGGVLRRAASSRRWGQTRDRASVGNTPRFGGLRSRRFEAHRLTVDPPLHAETRVAWEGSESSYPERPDIPIRVEAAAHRGRPVAFYAVAPWTRAERDEAHRLSTSLRASNLILGLLFVGLLAAAVLLARHHLRSGRGDRRGSFRLALAAFILAIASWALRAHHLSTFEGELGLAVFGLAGALLTATVIWIFYVAPLVRRLWPHALISWTRLLATGPRDPLVGRDLLVGVAAGSLVALLLFVALRLPVWLGSAAFEPVWGPQGLDTLLSLKYILAAIVEQPIASSALATGSA
jgi:serine/threonine-protein kinase